MNLSRVKITVLAAVLLLGMVVFAIPGVAQCPPGTIDLSNAANYGLAPLPITAAGNIVTAGTYCVPSTGVLLGAAGIPATLTATVNDVTIVGETAGATMTGSGGANMVVVNLGLTNMTIQNFTMVPVGAAGDTAITANGETVIQGMTFRSFASAGNTFNVYTVQLGGNDCVVENCTFNVQTDPATAIELNGGLGARIVNNDVIGAGGNPAFFVRNIGAAPYNDLLVSLNTLNAAGTLVGGGGLNTYTNSVISDNTATLLNGTGIDLGGNPSNCQVLRNTYTYRGGVAGVGLLDGGGSNNTYSDNRITCAAGGGAGDNGIEFGSSNPVISGNTIDVNGGDSGIDAATSGGSNATITNNTILGAGVGDGIEMSAAGNSNFTITGNSISNTALAGINNAAGAGTNHTISGNTLTNIGGVGIDSSGNNVITGNTLTGVPAGDGIQSNINDQVTNNTISSVGGVNHGIDVVGGNTLVDQNGISNVSGGGNGINIPGGNCNITNNTIDNVSAGGHGILLGANNQTITGNTITNIYTGGRGIDIVAQLNNTVSNNNIDGVSQSGIRVTTGDNNTISGNTIVDPARDSVSAVAEFAGILLAGGNATNNVVDGNTITNPGSTTYAVGIDVLGVGSNNNDIINNTVNGFTTVTGASTTTAIGIRLQVGTNNTLVGNTVSNSGNMRVGIDVLTPNELPVKDNTIEGMIDFGLRLRGGTVNNPLEVEGNILTGNVTGISMESGAADITNVNKVSGGATALAVGALGNAANFAVHGNCFDSPILANNQGLGTLDATGNYWASTPVAGANVFGNVDFSSPLASCPGEPTPPPSKTHTYGAAAGWYMASVPLNSGTPSALFGTIAYSWNCATGVYDLVSMIEPEFGYWVTLPANKSVTDSGSQVTSDVTINISCTGWHQVSAPWSYPKSAIQVIQGVVTKTWADAVTAGWVRDDIYAYSATGTDYTTPSTINPWYGYWVRANVSGLSLKLLYASGTPVSAGFAPMGPKALVVPADLPPMPPSPSVGAADLEFGNYPNPIVDVYTTTFAVKGSKAAFVDAVKVEIYDLSGRLVYASGEMPGTSLDWHTDNDYGEYLANGVYLYKLYALYNGEWVTKEVRKLAILR